MRNVTRRPRSAGFTLIELLVVMLIIGLLIAFILAASFQSLQRAEGRASQGTIAKLDAGLSDRTEALLFGNAPSVNRAHEFLAASYNPTVGIPVPGTAGPADLGGLAGAARARVIAQFDYAKAEMPDVFYVQVPAQFLDPGNPSLLASMPNYPNVYLFNFAAQPYNGAPNPNLTMPSALRNLYAPYILPLGNAISWDPNNALNGGASYGGYVPGTYPPATPTIDDINPPGYSRTGTGIFGASYAAAGALLRNVGNVPPSLLGGLTPTPLKPQGYDGVDNDGDDLVDELDEGLDGTPDQLASIVLTLFNHRHKTARAEMLYALLIEGRGPLGSVYNREDFTDREVGDTDNDGLPEFIDAWGEPIQFYRWPIFYQSDIQKGIDIYRGVNDERQQDSLDGNQQLVTPSWWWGGINSGFSGDPFSGSYQANQGGPSGRAIAFQNYFHTLLDYNAAPPATSPPPPGSTWWDRGAFYRRRSYYSRPLIVSSGPDRKLGLAQLGFDYGDYGINSNPPVPINATNLIQIENTASVLPPVRSAAPFYTFDSSDPTAAAIFIGQQEWVQDDITNQTLQARGGGAP